MLSSTLRIFVAVGSAGAVATSTDGNTWVAQTAAAALSWRSVAWSPALGLLVAVAISREYSAFPWENCTDVAIGI
jgi:hypothetical protein